LRCSLQDRGLKFIAKDRVERIALIADAIAATDHDIVGLQELWVYADYEHIRGKVASRLPHSKFFHRCAASGNRSLS
jgi:sphingomyelin phosphodiesterase 2